MANKPGVKWVKRALIESPYCIGLCKKESHFNQAMKRLKVPLSNRPQWIGAGDATAHFFKNGSNKFCIVCIQKGLKRYQAYGLLVHEAVHVWQYVKKDLHEKTPSKEFEAYSIQMISQCLIAAYEGS